MNAIAVSDLHGNIKKYNKLAEYAINYKPDLVFICGDILPNFYVTEPVRFINDFLKPLLYEIKTTLKDNYLHVLLITGNDDPAVYDTALTGLEKEGLIYFINNKVISLNNIEIAGYQFVPPTPFQLKDAEKYDVSQLTPRGSVSPEEGLRTIEIPLNTIKYSTIKSDLDELAKGINNFRKTVCMFHSPPYDTNLDKMAGRNISGEEEIVSVGSIAIRRFIEKYQPLAALHGHIHESSRISGRWEDKIGDTYCYNAAYNGNELALIKFDIYNLSNAARLLL